MQLEEIKYTNTGTRNYNYKGPNSMRETPTTYGSEKGLNHFGFIICRKLQL